MSSQTNRRLHRLIAHIYPAAQAQHEVDGSWPTREGGNPDNPAHGQAPFVIDTTRDGQTRLRLTGAEGDLVSGIGPDLDAAIDAIAEKLKIALDAKGA